jgi:hypothetical protein
VVGLDIRTFGDGEAHVGEDGGDLVDDLGDGVDAAALGRRRAHRQADIDGFARQPFGDGGVPELGLAGGDGIGDARLEAVDCRTRLLALFRCHLAQALEQFGHRALLAECRDPHRLDGRFIGTGGDFVHDGSFKGLVLAHGL